jgi:hypothetical protein
MHQVRAVYADILLVKEGHRPMHQRQLLAVRAAIGKARRAGLKDIAAFFLHDPAVRAAASTANGGRVDVPAVCLVFAFQVSVGETWDDLVRKNQDMKTSEH